MICAKKTAFSHFKCTKKFNIRPLPTKMHLLQLALFWLKLCQKCRFIVLLSTYLRFIYLCGMRVSAWSCSLPLRYSYMCARACVYIYSAKEVIRWDTQHVDLKSIRPLQFAGPIVNGTSAFSWEVDECWIFFVHLKWLNAELFLYKSNVSFGIHSASYKGVCPEIKQH